MTELVLPNGAEAGSQESLPVRWSTFPTLLSLLDTSKVAALEDVVCAHHCGRFDEATTIIKETWANPHESPIVAMEYSDMLTTQGLEHERLDLIKATLQHMDIQDATELDRGDEIKELMRLMLADALYWVNGSLSTALTAARHFASWLRSCENFPPTDVQVSCPCGQIFVIIKFRPLTKNLDSRRHALSSTYADRSRQLELHRK